MRDFNKSGYCNIEELSDIIQECDEVVMLANNINKSNFKTYIEIRELSLNYDCGEYNIHITYEIKKRDEQYDKERTFGKAT